MKLLYLGLGLLLSGTIICLYIATCGQERVIFMPIAIVGIGQVVVGMVMIVCEVDK